MQPALRLALGLTLLFAGCFVDAPGESSSEGASLTETTSIESAGPASAGASSAGTTDSTTGNTADATETTSSTGDPMTSSGTTLATTSGTTTSTTGDGSTTIGDLPNPLVIPAKIAACVLLESGQYAYLGPDACTEAATDHNGTETQGVIVLDAEFLPAMGRPAQIYLNFPIPPIVGQLNVKSAELTMLLADGQKAGGRVGDLHQVAAFSLAELNTATPAPLNLLLEDPGIVLEPGAMVSRTIPPKVLLDGVENGNVYLGLIPADPDGSLYHGLESGPDLTPSLVITYE